MRAWIGKSLFAIGAVHTLFGLVVMRGTLAVLWGEGLFNTVHGQPRREAVFWFLYTGFLLLVLGALIDRQEKAGLAMPIGVAWSFLALSVAGILVMPISGLWLLVPPALGLLRQAGALRRRTGGDTPSSGRHPPRASAAR